MLGLRLAALAVVLSAIFTAIAYFNNQARIETDIVDLARIQVHRFNQQVLPLLDRPAGFSPDDMQQELEIYAAGSGGTKTSDGRFVAVRIFGESGRELARRSDDAYSEIQVVEQAMDEADPRPLAPDEHRVVTVRLEGSPYVGVAIPMTNSRNEVIAQLIGAFAISPAAVERIRGDILRTILYVIGIVLLTAAAVYPIIGRLIGRMTNLTLSLLDSNLETMQVLGGAIAKRDSDTDAHNYRVAVYSVKLAEAVELPRHQIKSLIKGALLHDVGKLGIRDNVLLKPGKLNDEEFAVMKTHVQHGMDITARASWLKDAQEIVSGHHEKFDGAGYPAGLSGGAIPLGARIFAIVDVFDALTSKRPYKDPLPFEETMEILEAGRGSHFDPDLLDEFESIAHDLYAEYGGNEGHGPRERLGEITERYFKRDVEDLLS